LLPNVAVVTGGRKAIEAGAGALNNNTDQLPLPSVMVRLTRHKATGCN